MTRTRALLLAGLMGGSGSACGDEPSHPDGAAPPGHGIAPGPTSSASPSLRGTVLTTMDAGRYTYIEFSGVPRAESGRTVGELFEHREELAGQQVTVRGVVVKCLSGIMGKNWIHLRDGTAGPGGADELTVTSLEAAGVGSTLVVRGTVVVDKDYGYGYAYDLLLEDASITIE